MQAKDCPLILLLRTSHSTHHLRENITQTNEKEKFPQIYILKNNPRIGIKCEHLNSQ